MWPLIWNGWVLLYLCGHKSSPDDNRFHVVPRLCFALHYLKDNWSLLTSILVIIDNTVDESISYLCPLEEDVLSLLVVAELHGFIRNWNLRFVINIPSFFSSTSYIFIVISKRAIFHPSYLCDRNRLPRQHRLIGNGTSRHQDCVTLHDVSWF